ncbi:MAG: type III-B CRISPR module-associated Cmr3 family protein [Verrucomicrobiota bacterium]
MNTILLQPTDVLFFRDGRPMTGSLAGHGAAWPLPSVINAAFHAALHRSGFAKESHSHRRGARGVYAEDAQRDRKFGSLVTAGPFPVKEQSTWFFPRPQDLQDATLQPALLPTGAFDSIQSSLPDPLEYAVANRLPPAKESGAAGWISKDAYERYLAGTDPALRNGDAVNDSDFSDTEHSIGIAIDPDTGTTGQGDALGKIYSAHYLRLRDAWQIGVCAAAEDKDFSHHSYGRDLVKALLNGGQHQIIVGGQQRICSALRVEAPALPLPVGKSDDFHERDGRVLVKWILLSPAVWPAIPEDATRRINAHAGGWLPNWIAQQASQFEGEPVNAGEVLLLDGVGREKARRKKLQPGSRIRARLVAAIVPKPLVVTGWALPNEHGENEAERSGGAQSTHLAVPPGAVYYFEADSADDARKLAAALNWHGSETSPAAIKNRRSTLLGEKGFGLGVCGTWQFHENVPGRPAPRQI